MNRTNHKSPAQVNVKKSVSAARAAGITETDIRRLLAGGRLGQPISGHEMREIVKGITFGRWAMLKKSIRQCDRKLAVKNLSADIWVAINKAKVEYLVQMRQLNQDIDELAKGDQSCGNAQPSLHAFGPREQIGNVRAVNQPTRSDA